MGSSLAWNATRGIPADDALQRQGLSATNRRADYTESAISSMPLDDGWLLVVARGCDHRIIGESNLSKLSLGCEVIACSIEEHAMFSSSELWSNGKRLWRVEHDAQQAFDHLSATGSLPDDYGPTKAHFAAHQEAEGGAKADVDLYFEIPLVLAQSRVGFKHDEVNAEDTDGSFDVLHDTSPPEVRHSRQWWQFWK